MLVWLEVLLELFGSGAGSWTLRVVELEVLLELSSSEAGSWKDLVNLDLLPLNDLLKKY